MVMGKTIDNLYFEAYYRENLAVINLKSEVFNFITDLDESQVMMDFIRDAEHNHDVKGLLILNEPGCLGEEAYDDFIRSILGNSDPDDEKEVPAFHAENYQVPADQYPEPVPPLPGRIP